MDGRGFDEWRAPQFHLVWITWRLIRLIHSQFETNPYAYREDYTGPWQCSALCLINLSICYRFKKQRSVQFSVSSCYNFHNSLLFLSFLTVYSIFLLKYKELLEKNPTTFLGGKLRMKMRKRFSTLDKVRTVTQRHLPKFIPPPILRTGRYLLHRTSITRDAASVLCFTGLQLGMN